MGGIYICWKEEGEEDEEEEEEGEEAVTTGGPNIVPIRAGRSGLLLNGG